MFDFMKEWYSIKEKGKRENDSVFSNLRRKMDSSENANIQHLISHIDITYVKQGLQLLDDLQPSLEEIYQSLHIPEPSSKEEWAQCLYSKETPHRSYVKLWLLGKLWEQNIAWVMNLKKLEISSCIPAGITALKQIEQLKISNRTDTTFTIPKEFTGLKTLTIEGCSKLQILHLSPAQLTSLEEISLSENYELHTIQGLSEFTGLKDLYIHYSNIRDFSPLLQLTNLHRLTLSMVETFTDLQFLRNMKELNRLSIDGTQVSDLKPLQQLPKLDYLDIIWCHQITDLTPLYSLPKLSILYVTINYEESELANQFAELKNLRPDIDLST